MAWVVKRAKLNFKKVFFWNTLLGNVKKDCKLSLSWSRSPFSVRIESWDQTRLSNSVMGSKLSELSSECYKIFAACVLLLEKIRGTTTTFQIGWWLCPRGRMLQQFWGKILCNSAGWAGRPNPDANGPLRSATLALLHLQPPVPAAFTAPFISALQHWRTSQRGHEWVPGWGNNFR